MEHKKKRSDALMNTLGHIVIYVTRNHEILKQQKVADSWSRIEYFYNLSTNVIQF